MRRSSWIAILGLATAACASGGGGASSSGGGTAASPSAGPSSGPVSAADSKGDPQTCAGTSCKVTVVISKDIADNFNRYKANFKVYEGCPKLYGVSVDDTTAAAGFASVPAFFSTPIPVITIPNTMKGHIATVLLWFGSVPYRMIVVDLSQNPTPTIDFGLVPAAAASGFTAAGHTTTSAGGIGGGKAGSSQGSDGGMTMSSSTMGSAAATGLLGGTMQDDKSLDKKNQNALHKICK